MDTLLIYKWWKDKPHQIARRLLMRLTRAETELEKLKSSAR